MAGIYRSSDVSGNKINIYVSETIELLSSRISCFIFPSLFIFAKFFRVVHFNSVFQYISALNVHRKEHSSKDFNELENRLHSFGKFHFT